MIWNDNLVGGVGMRDTYVKKYDMCQLLPSDPFGDFKWPVQGWKRDLHLGYHKVTGKNLVHLSILGAFFSQLFGVKIQQKQTTLALLCGPEGF